MTTKISNKSLRKLDFETMLGDPEKIQPRTLKEIADEVGFPFTARVVAGPGDNHSEDTLLPVGTERTLSYDESEINQSIRPNERFVDRKAKESVNAQLCRWVILGHK